MRTEIFNERITAAQGAKHVIAQSAQKKSLREELENEVEKFLSNGGSINTLSGIDFKPKQPSKRVERIKPWRELKQPEYAKSERNTELREWVRAKLGRVKNLALAMGVLQWYISARTSGQVFITAADFEHEIKPAMKCVEKWEQQNEKA